MKRPQLIVALDLDTVAGALRIARHVRRWARTVKIGSVLFTQAGPSAIRQMRALGLEVMLDLKFFDIPSTVEQSVRAAVRHRVRWLTVHASGGRPMLQAAVRAARTEATRRRLPRPRILGVTVLTSDGKWSRRRVTRRVLTLAQEAASAGCDGVVASAQEAASLRRRFGTRLTIACPGIRPAGSRRADQARVMSPREAVAAGADLLIVGRPITAASDPGHATRAILSELQR